VQKDGTGPDPPVWVDELCHTARVTDCFSLIVEISFLLACALR
jgi:hypothetical protein